MYAESQKHKKVMKNCKMVLFLNPKKKKQKNAALGNLKTHILNQ